MGYIVDGGKEIYTTPEGTFSFANPCSPMGGHEYAEVICPRCGRDFCFQCCARTNVHEGGGYHPPFMTCPNCGQDYYEEG